MIVNNKLKKKTGNIKIALFQVVCRYLPGGTEKNHKFLSQLVSRSRYEIGTPQTRHKRYHLSQIVQRHNRRGIAVIWQFAQNA